MGFVKLWLGPAALLIAVAFGMYLVGGINGATESKQWKLENIPDTGSVKKDPVKVQPLTIYGPWEDERFRVEQHRDSTSEYRMTITSIFDKALQREVVVLGWLSAPVVLSIYDVPKPQPKPAELPPPAPKADEQKK